MAANEPIKTVIIDRPGVAPAGDLPPVLVRMQPVVSILVRAARTFLQVFLGALGIGAVTSIFPTNDFQTAVVRAAGIAAASAFLSLCQNTLELLARLDERAPEVRA